jgi:hypothetical protein
MNVTTDRAAVSHVSGWHTYDVAFSLSNRRSERSATFFAPDDAAAVVYCADVVDEAVAYATTSKGKPAARNVKLTRRA